MKLHQFLATTLFTLSLVGCCCGRNVVMDPGDPCGVYVDSGCGFSRGSLFNWRLGGGCRSCGKCPNCGGFDDYSTASGCGGGGTCGGGSSYGGAANYGSPSQSSCGCGQTSSYTDPTYSGSSVPYIDGSSGGTPVPSLRSAPIPPPTPPVAPTPSSPSTWIPPIPGSESSMMMSPPQTQMVSFEEFQRLPGTIVSGPGAVTNSSSNQVQSAAAAPLFLPPSPSATPR